MKLNQFDYRMARVYLSRGLSPEQVASHRTRVAMMQLVAQRAEPARRVRSFVPARSSWAPGLFRRWGF